MKIVNWKLEIVKHWLPVLIWAGFIFWLSSLPNLESGLEQDFVLRKIAHILEYAVLTFLLFRAFSVQGGPAPKILVLAVIFALFYALTDEYHQTFIFGREGTLRDVVIDSIGILITTGVWYIKNRKFRI